MLNQKEIKNGQEKYYQHGAENKAVKTENKYSAKYGKENDKRMKFYPVFKEKRPQNIVYLF